MQAMDSEEFAELVEEVLGVEIKLSCLDDEHFFWYEVDGGGIDPEAGVDNVWDLFTQEQEKMLRKHMDDNGLDY